MKNIYELSKEDKKKMREEFYKTEFGKKILSGIKEILYFFIIICVISVLADTVLFEMLQEMEMEDIVNLIDTVGNIALVLAAIMTIISEFALIRWMKIKHKVEY